MIQYIESPRFGWEPEEEEFLTHLVALISEIIDYVAKQMISKGLKLHVPDVSIL
jgi:hypothetical protein